MNVILAHGIGERADLPVPFAYALTGAVIALIVSFVVLSYAWKIPRFEDGTRGRALPRLTRLIGARWFRLGLRAIGLVAAGYVGVAAILGPDLAINPTFGAVYVLLWLGLVLVSVLFGPVWRYLNPIRTLHVLLTKLFRIPTRRGLFALPARVGYWPAAIGLFAFVWLELIAPGNTTLPVVRLWFAAYIVIQLFAGLLYGSRWYDKGDAFEVYSALFGRLSCLGRRDDGVLVVRNPLVNLAQLPVASGLVAVVAVLLGSTGFDGFSMAPYWVRMVQGSPLDGTVLGTLVLLGFVLFVAGTFWLATRTVGGPTAPGVFVSSVVPIALGYVIAHYVTLFVTEGQRALIYLSDPLSNGANLLGLSGRGVADGFVSDPTTVATIKVVAVVLGHIIGILAAHDRAVAVLGDRALAATEASGAQARAAPAGLRTSAPGDATGLRDRAVFLGQIPLLVVMVGYTLGGLTLLFAT